MSLRDIFGPGKKGVLFAVPGAFTPGCSKTHLPGFVAKADALKAAGADAVVCVCPNDPFVTAAWGEANGAGGKVIMLADTQLALTKAWDQVLDAEEALGSKRSKRYSVVIADGKVSAFNAEPDGTGLTCSLADPTLGQAAQGISSCEAGGWGGGQACMACWVQAQPVPADTLPSMLQLEDIKNKTKNTFFNA